MIPTSHHLQSLHFTALNRCHEGFLISNDPNADAIRGRDRTQAPTPKPVMTEQEKEALSARNTE
jgi:hypothetical protein